MKQLAEFKEGSRVMIGGMVWDVLQNDGERVLCLSDEILEYKEFDTDSSNDWKKSSIRERLNKKFYEVLCQEMLAKGQDVSAILEQEQDLTADDGLEDYGSSTDKVFLLTCEQYRKFRKYIRKEKDWWWLITPDSPINCRARSVITGGTLGDYLACNGGRGVRPACVFSSSIMVESAEE